MERLAGLSRARIATWVVVALGMWALKDHYARARPDDLAWILGPTARMVTWVTGVRFELESGSGYLCRERLFAIEKSCAGVNFMIAAFGMSGFVLSRRVVSLATAVPLISVSSGVSYAAALVANTFRISVALWLAAHPLGWTFISASQVHRLEGVVVYFGGLVVLHSLVRRFMALPSNRSLDRQRRFAGGSS